MKKEVEDPSWHAHTPDHYGALAFTDRGIMMSNGKEKYQYPWNDAESRGFSSEDFEDMVAALPVPAKELLELFDKKAEADVDESAWYDFHTAMENFMDAVQEQWARAGVVHSKPED